MSGMEMTLKCQKHDISRRASNFERGGERRLKEREPVRRGSSAGHGAMASIAADLHARSRDQNVIASNDLRGNEKICAIMKSLIDNPVANLPRK